MTNEQIKFIEPILKTFENEDIKNFAIEIVDSFPEYIWEVGASSTGKYHPAFTLGKTGLMKHQIAVVRFINFFFELDQYKRRFDSRQRDLLRVAALSHDGFKSGTQEEYNKNKYTKFNHPILMAEHIVSYKDKSVLSEEELKYIASAIRKHMGSWNTDKKSNLTLPTPNDEASEILHLADYLASRKALDMSFEGYVTPQQETSTLPDINTYKMPFGKHAGLLLKDIPDGYLHWLSSQDLKEPLRSLVNQLV